MHSINPLLKDFIFLTTQYKIEHLKVKKDKFSGCCTTIASSSIWQGGGTYPEE